MGEQGGKVFLKRLESLRSMLDMWEVDAFLITSSKNRRWLSGFTGSAGILLVSRDKAFLGTDSRYWEQAQEQSPEFELFKFIGPMDAALNELVNLGGVTRIGFEADHVTVDRFTKYSKIEKISWLEVTDMLTEFRQRKDESEIATIHAAAGITDTAMELVNTLARPGVNEKELAWQLEKIMKENGATGLAFPVIVASGSNSARPHHEPGEKLLETGDTIIIDMGAKLNGYCSDMTRTFFLGAKPDDQFDKIYGTVLAAQQKAINNMQAGMTGKEIDALSRDVIADAGFGEEFGHGLGHSLGLDIHEMPRLSPLADADFIEEGVVVTVEPGVYIAGWGGVRIEDLVLVRNDGVRILSDCPKIPRIPV